VPAEDYIVVGVIDAEKTTASEQTKMTAHNGIGSALRGMSATRIDRDALSGCLRTKGQSRIHAFAGVGPSFQTFPAVHAFLAKSWVKERVGAAGRPR